MLTTKSCIVTMINTHYTANIQLLPPLTGFCQLLVELLPKICIPLNIIPVILVITATGYPGNLMQDIHDSKLVRPDRSFTMRQQHRNQISRERERAGCIAVCLLALRQERRHIIRQCTSPLFTSTRAPVGPVPTTQIAPLLNAANITQLLVFGLR